MKQILVPLDGSDLAEAALPYAEAIARAGNAAVVLMRGIITLPNRLRDAAEFNRTVRKEAADYLAPLLTHMQERGVTGRTLLVEDEAAYAILQAAAREAPDLIVMSTHGRGAMGRALWGSVADRVLRASPVPVFLVPRNAKASWEIAEAPSLILPLDGSTDAEAALPPAIELATTLQARIILLQAINPLPVLAGPDAWVIYETYETQFAEQKAAAAKYLESVATQLGERGLATSILVAEGAPAGVIQSAAVANQALAIVMATHGRGGALRLLLGSTAEALVRSAPVPIILIRSVEAHAETSPQPPAAPRAVEPVQQLSVTTADVELLEDALQHWIRGRHGGEGLVMAFDLLARVDALKQVEARAREVSEVTLKVPVA